MDKYCCLQRVVASEKFLLSKKKGFDCVIVRSDSDERNQAIASGHCKGSSSHSLWFGRALSFLKNPAFRSTNRHQSDCKILNS